MFTPYKSQQVAIDHCCSFFENATMGQKQLYAAPTGYGKSVIELLVQQRRAHKRHWIVSPSDDIIAGMLNKLDLPEDTNSIDHRICTPIKLRNRLLKGELEHPEELQFDEGHHQEANTWQELDLLTGMCPAVAFTATPYRGTPRSTRAFLERWGKPLWIITYKEAQQAGYIKMPTYQMLPLVNDDYIEIGTGGEFEINSIDAATMGRLGDIAEHSRAWYKDKWDKPTIYALPSSATCLELQREMHSRGLPTAIVAAGTPKDERRGIFAAVEAGIVALLHINIVCIAEGEPVLTDSGWRPIQDVKLTDLVWDGVEWVTHKGVVCNGEHDCIKVDGVKLTRDHLILTQEGWLPACLITQATPRLAEHTTDGRCLVNHVMDTLANADVPAALLQSDWIRALYAASLEVAATVSDLTMQSLEPSTIQLMAKCQSTLEACSGKQNGLYPDATTWPTKTTSIMGPEASKFVRHGEQICLHSLQTLQRCLVTSNIGYLTELLTMATTNLATCNLPQSPCNVAISATQASSIANAKLCSQKSLSNASGICMLKASVNPNSQTCIASASTQFAQCSKVEHVKTYDITYAGPRHRYQVGSLIVHNSEGVDLKLRRFVDLSPTLSPVKWCQRMGRITRPTTEDNEYICCNRNLLRHAYILEGVVPDDAIAAAVKAFGISERSNARVIGLEAIGRFKPGVLELMTGLKAHIYSMATVLGGVVFEYCCIIHPTRQPIWAVKINTNVDGVKKYGNWAKCDKPPEDMTGFASHGMREPSEKQMSWWSRQAARVGIQPDQEVGRKTFQALPVLSDLGEKLW